VIRLVFSSNYIPLGATEVQGLVNDFSPLFLGF